MEFSLVLICIFTGVKIMRAGGIKIYSFAGSQLRVCKSTVHEKNSK